MGGNALKLVGLESRRISTDELHSLCSDVELLTGNLFAGLEPVKFWHEKPTHGDIDFVAHVRPEFMENWESSVSSALNSKGFHRNRPVCSLEFKGVQIDIAGQESDADMRAYLDFCHYSPCGNVIGRMLKQTGAKWGVDGLSYPVREQVDGEGQLLGNVPLSRDMKEILSLAGLDHETWKSGFEKQEDIFNFCAGSSLFNKEIFAFENLNHINRKRDRLRADYHSWIEHIQGRDDTYSRYANDEERSAKKTEWFAVLCEKFPHLGDAAEAIHQAANIKKELAAKFNGGTVGELTGLKGKELGVTLGAFIGHIGGHEGFDAWRADGDVEALKASFLEFYNKSGGPAGMPLPNDCGKVEQRNVAKGFR